MRTLGGIAGSGDRVKIPPKVGTRGGLFDYFLATQKVIKKNSIEHNGHQAT